ncbi:MAG: hypothetical protein GWN71_41130, partial [Gammaproteobacteria bacterium]|nr:hypothetical protein [Gemmatimonadota bacterium]NIU79720.1 hypothetical protein [Gammaproteobacteria bacterium]
MSGGGGGRSRAPRAYRALLWLLPGRLRRRHGRAMEASFVEALERAGSGGPSRTRVWLGAVGDVLRRAVYERVRRPAGSSSLLRTLLPDVRFALRGFVRRPGMTLLAVVMLAVGVGSCTAV